jgi:hypothetical protein
MPRRLVTNAHPPQSVKTVSVDVCAAKVQSCFSGAGLMMGIVQVGVDADIAEDILMS